MLSNQEMTRITGGAIKFSLGIIIASIGAFIAGIIDGYLRPLGCHK